MHFSKRNWNENILTLRGTLGGVLDDEVSRSRHDWRRLMESTEILILSAIEDGTRVEDGTRRGDDGTKSRRWGYCCSEATGEHCCLALKEGQQVTGEGQRGGESRRLEEN
jgi:hypothetical protein